MATTRRPRALVTVMVLGAALAVTACGGSDAPVARGRCPVAPVKVTVTIDQWSDLVRTLAGDCAVVRTVVESTTADPHEFEPTPADTAAVAGADLVVRNGLGYDEWAAKAVAAAPTPPTVVEAGASRATGSNPHVWYDPTAVDDVARRTTTALAGALPGAANYLRTRTAAWTAALRPYREAVRRTAVTARGRTYAATEPVAEHLASALGITDVTPPGFARAAANETEPAPGDVADLLDLLAARKVDVLLLNTQRAGALNGQVRAAARNAGVPVVEVTETVPPDATGFVDWQVGQLDRLAAALTGTAR